MTHNPAEALRDFIAELPRASMTPTALASRILEFQSTLTSPAPAGGEANDLERVASALVILARTNIPTDIQDLLVNGDPDRGIAPGALGKAIAFALTPPPASGDVAGVVERLRDLGSREWWVTMPAHTTETAREAATLLESQGRLEAENAVLVQRAAGACVERGTRHGLKPETVAALSKGTDKQ